jgi:DNA gyrase/topoisomerase IV subunit B
MAANKDIEVLSDFEHVLRKPTIYVGSVQPSEERIPILRDDLIYEEQKTISVGMYKILNEAIDNAFDEAKRQGGKGITIRVHFNSKNNSVSVSDSGGGFKNAAKIHPKSKMTMVETALCMLRAGSNFNNDSIDENIVGTNGMGISLTNMLSDEFSVETCDGKQMYCQTWNNFKSTGHRITPNKSGTTGTKITFIPRKSTFSGCKWDKNYITTQMAFRKWILSFDPILKNVEFIVEWDEKPLQLPVDFFPEDRITVTTKIGAVCVYKKFQGGIRTSFINGTQASSTGQRQVHETVVTEALNEILGYDMAHQFYETVITLNVPPALMRFGDQNKTRFVTVRNELLAFVEPLINKLKREFKGSDVEASIRKAIDEYQHKGELKKIRSAKRDNSIKFSEKYFPPGKKKNRIFICEGLSAAGSLAQRRDKDGDAVYALRGKVKNVQSISDLTSNKEVMDLINILGLDFEDKTCDFKDLIIATDSDCLSGDTKIVTQNGLKSISDIQLGEMVLTHDGTFNRVVNTVSRIEDKLVKIRIYGKTVTCSENHKWLVVRDGVVIEVKAKDLLETDFFMISK